MDVLAFIIAMLVIYPIIRALEQWWISRYLRADTSPGGFPVVGADRWPRPGIPLPEDGPGRYRIVGVVAASQTDIKMDIEAESMANAKVKAELRGVIVTDISRIQRLDLPRNAPTAGRVYSPNNIEE